MAGLYSIYFTFLLIISVCSFIAIKTHAGSSLTAGSPLADGESLVSSGGIFELGFFTPGGSKSRYVGIWYRNFSTSTVLWVANRESPIPNTSGSLAIIDDGNLAVLDGRNTVLWSSSINSSKNSTAKLSDSGDLTLINSFGETVWQSFDHPTDTYLPGMKVGLDLVTNVNQVFTSWKSEDDPAPGNFTLGIDPDRSTQIFIWEAGKPRWRSGRWNGQVFIGIQNMVPTYIYGFKLSNFEQEKKMYFYYNEFNSSHRYVLMPDGVERHMVWEKDSSHWYQYWAQPVTECEIYNRCGNYASCTDGNGGSPECSCLRGFEPNSGVCTRRTPLQCETAAGGSKPDRFYLMQGVKLPDLSMWETDPTNASQCAEACLKNCSCKAYSFVTGIGCLVWGSELVDIHLFSGGGGNDFYLRLAGSEFDDKKGLKGYIIGIIVLLAVVLSVVCVFFIWRNKKRIEELYRRRMNRQESLVDPNRRGGERSRSFSAVIDVHEEGKEMKCGQDVPLFSFGTIEEATNKFCSSNLLGEGGFGPVFKGVLPGGQEIAVKKLSRSSGQGLEEFKNEVVLIAKLQHRNLVRLLGFCIERQDKLLVYEYMPNRSLDAFLFDTNRRSFLDWKTRYSIIEGIARGLLYLHRDSRLRIIHRDLKASNILLDGEMNPKISDFGMARIFGSDGSETSTKRVVGTYGYMSPEYAMQGLFSVKSDVYSFGVLLIEIISGKRNNTYYNPELSLNLLGNAWKQWNEDNVMELVDQPVRNSCLIKEVSRCINVGLLCVQDRANDRPTMQTVILMLESENTILAMPRQPTFPTDMSTSETDSSTLDQRASSADAFITMISGR